jgi:thiol-disulfide isomerase/thioredoxin
VRFRNPILFLLVIALAASAWLAWAPTPAPPASFATITGAKPSLADWRGQPVLIAFWATDCPTCLKEIPMLKDLHGRYAPRGLRMVAVAMPYDLPSRVVSFAREWALPYAVALDPSGENARAFDVSVTPTTFLLDANSRIRSRIVGDFDPAKMGALIETLLNDT